jgi:hypothetical protein
MSLLYHILLQKLITKTYYKSRNEEAVEKTPSYHRQMTGGFTRLEEVFIKVLLIF